MGPRDWFSVGVRLLGVYVFYRSVAHWLILLADIVSRSELSNELDTSPSQTGEILVFAVGNLVLSYVLIFGADRLTRWAFNEPSPDDTLGKPE